MIVGTCTVELRLFEIYSLKEKRHILKSLIGRIQSRFNVSISEVEKQDSWGSSIIGFACVTTTVRHADQMINNILKFIEGDLRVEIVSHSTEIL